MSDARAPCRRTRSSTATACSRRRRRRSRRRGRLECRGDDVRGHRDQRGHDHVALLAPADNPDQLAALRADRSLGANAVEESLRLEPAAARVDRYATADTELGGAAIRRGDLVIVSLTAANRDPATFPDRCVRPLAAERAVAPRVRPGPARLCRDPPGQAGDAGQPSKPCSTDGPGSRSTRAPRRRAASSSGSRGRSPSAGTSRRLA